MKLLDISGLSRAFGGLQAVNNVGFSMDKGMIKGIIGPNGAGKTTLFNLISGMTKSDSGRITFNGKPIHNAPPHKIAAHGILRTFQNIKLFGKMTVLENVMVGLHRASAAGFLAGLCNHPRSWNEEKHIRRMALETLEMVGIAYLAHRDALGLAFGQQRYVELARALAAQPILLMLDEPAAGLNMRETEQLGATILRLRDQGITVLLVEHDMSLVMNVSDEIVVLSSGKIIAEGKPRDIRKNPGVIKAYLGGGDAQD
jgi:branched-chain amino acid transport system ATP-binding protein